MPSSQDLKSVLIVDDDSRLSAVWRDTLEARGIRVAAEQDAESGIAALREEQFDVVIVDLLLRDPSGIPSPEGSLALLASIGLNAFRAPKVLAVSGFEEAAERYQGYRILTPANTLLKPVDPNRLADHVTDLIAQRDREEEAAVMGRAFKFTTDHSQSAVYWLREDGTISYANRGASQMLGHSRESLCGRSIEAIDPSFTAEKWAEHWRLIQQQEFAETDTTHVDAQGRPISVQSYSYYYNFEGYEFIVCSARNISDLKQSNQQLQQATQFLEMSHDAMFSWSEDHGIRTWNLGAERLYGYTADEALGQTSHTLLQTTHSVPWEQIADTINRQGEWIGELDHVTKDGRTVTVSTRHQKLEFDDEHVVLETNRDITNMARQKSLLQDAESRLRGLFDNSSNFLGLMSLDGVLLDANRPALDAAGVAAEDVLGKSFWETPWWSHSQELQERLKQAVKRASLGQTDSFSATHTMGGDKMMEIETTLSTIFSPDGEFVYLLSEGRDVTAHNTASRQLNRVESHLQNLGEIVEQSRNEVFIFRQEDFRFVYANRGAVENLGFSFDQITSMTPLDIKPNFTSDEFSQMLKPLSEGQVESLRFDTIYLRKDRSRYNTEVHLQTTHFNDEDCFVAIVLDTTALIQLIDDLKLANADLENFASVASHDLRTPLRGIENIASFLRDDEGGNLSETSLKYLDKMQDRVRRMDRLLDDLLTYSKLSRKQGELETIEVADMIENITELLSVPDGLEVCVAPEMPTLNTMVTPLHQVFLNLISNAIKYHDKPQGRIEVAAHDDGDFILFSVSDDGPGIAQKHHEQIFDMFQRLHDQQTVEGTGLGLAIVRRWVEQHGGKISIASELGNGATFMFTWPKHIDERRVYEY